MDFLSYVMVWSCLQPAINSLMSILMMYCFFVIFFLSSSDPESMEDNTSVEVLNAAKETLLQGLSEENQGLQ